MNHASALALAQFYVIDAIEGDVCYRVLPGDEWAGTEAQAVARISLPHLIGHEIILRAPGGATCLFTLHDSAMPGRRTRCAEGGLTRSRNA